MHVFLIYALNYRLLTYQFSMSIIRTREKTFKQEVKNRLKTIYYNLKVATATIL